MVERIGEGVPVVLRNLDEVEASLSRSGRANRVVVKTGGEPDTYTTAPEDVASRVERMRQAGFDVRFTHRVVIQEEDGKETVIDAGGVPYTVIHQEGEKSGGNGRN